MKRKDVEIHARELFEMVADMRRQMAVQDGIIQRQAAEITVLRAAGDKLADALAYHYDAHPLGSAPEQALAAWREVTA